MKKSNAYDIVLAALNGLWGIYNASIYQPKEAFIEHGVYRDIDAISISRLADGDTVLTVEPALVYEMQALRSYMDVFSPNEHISTAINVYWAIVLSKHSIHTDNVYRYIARYVKPVHDDLLLGMSVKIVPHIVLSSLTTVKRKYLRMLELGLDKQLENVWYAYLELLPYRNANPWSLVSAQRKLASKIYEQCVDSGEF